MTTADALHAAITGPEFWLMVGGYIVVGGFFRGVAWLDRDQGPVDPEGDR